GCAVNAAEMAVAFSCPHLLWPTGQGTSDMLFGYGEMSLSLYLPLCLSFCLSCRPTLHLSLSLHSYILSFNSLFLLLTRSLPLSLSLPHSLFPTLFLSSAPPL